MDPETTQNTTIHPILDPHDLEQISVIILYRDINNTQKLFLKKPLSL